MGNNWEMPKPVFRSSEGESALSVDPMPTTGDEHETLDPASNAPASPPVASFAAAPAPAQAPPPDIAEQPYISDAYSTEELGVAPTTTTAAPKPKSAIGTAVKVLLSLVVLFFLIGVAAFLYWFFALRLPQ